MAKLCGVFVLVGFALILGPGTITMCSGSKAASQEIALERPVTLELDPAMNPIAFILKFRYRIESSSLFDRERDLIGVLKSESGEVLWEEQFQFSISREHDSRIAGLGFGLTPVRFGIQTSPVRVFEVDRAGTYTFTASESTRPGASHDDIQFKSMELVVRQNVWNVGFGPMLLGFALAGLGAVTFFVVSNWPSQRKAPAQPPEDVT